MWPVKIELWTASSLVNMILFRFVNKDLLQLSSYLSSFCAKLFILALE